MSSNERLLHKHQRTEQESTESARNRFLRELENYASDDGNDHNNNNSQYNKSTKHCSEHQIKTFTSMFDEVESNDDYEERQPCTKIQRTESHDSESPNVALHVGRGLLQQMHQSSTSRNTYSVQSSSLSSHQQEKPEKFQQIHIFPQEQRELEVVDAYVPLSTGGFLNNVDAMDSVVSIKVGDVVCLRECNFNGAKCNETDSASHKKERCKAETPKSTCTENNEQASPTSRIIPSVPSLSSSSSLSSTLTSNTSTTLHHFRSESELSTREREYGVEPTVAMMQQMAQVTRLDKRRREAEICFVDDRRQKISLFNLRPAGFVEREFFAQWKQNSSSRPVPVIHSSAKDESNNNDSSSATIVNAARNTTSEVSTKSEADSTSLPPSKEAETLLWWVIPKLIVRVIARAVGCEQWYGQKCVVLSVVRREARIRLQQYLDNNNNTKSKGSKERCVSSHSALPIVEIIGQDAIETVLPKRGERGMVVLGEHRGELVQLLSRDKNDSKEVCSVNVLLLRSQETLSLAPHEVCKLASQ